MIKKDCTIYNLFVENVVKDLILCFTDSVKKHRMNLNDKELFINMLDAVLYFSVNSIDNFKSLLLNKNDIKKYITETREIFNDYLNQIEGYKDEN